MADGETYSEDILTGLWLQHVDGDGVGRLGLFAPGAGGRNMMSVWAAAGSLLLTQGGAAHPPACSSHSLQLDCDLPGLPRQVAHVPVAVKVGHQPKKNGEKKQTQNV